VKTLRAVVAWAKGRRWLAAAVTAAGGSAATAAADAVIHGYQSYALAAARAIAFGWHPFPAAAWLVVGPLCLAGCAWLRGRLFPPRPAGGEAQGVRWRCRWEGGRAVALEPVCPNPNCGGALTLAPDGGEPGADGAFACAAPGCGFRLRARESPAAVLAAAARELEGRPPPPPGPRRSRSW
jgi:hypothetical protein